MTSHVQHRRAMTAGALPPNLPLAIGELALNIPDRQLFSGAGGSPLPMIGVRVWTNTAAYAVGDMVANAGVLYTCKTAHGPQAFTASNWTLIGGSGSFLPITGGTLTGPLTVQGVTTFNAAPSWAASPTAPDHLTRKSYVDGAVGNYLPLTGGALTGDLKITEPGIAAFTINSSSAVSYGLVAVHNELDIPGRAIQMTYTGSAYAGGGNDPAGEYGVLKTTGAFPLLFGTTNLQRMRIGANGRVAIGVGESDGALFDVKGNVPNNHQATLARGGSGDNNFQLAATNGLTGTASGTLQARFGLAYTGASANAAGFDFYRGSSTVDSSLAIVAGNAERMRIDASGNVGIGASSISAALEIARSTTAELVLRGAGAAYGAGFSIQMNNDGNAYLFYRANGALGFGTNGAERMRIDATGSVGIATPSVFSWNSVFKVLAFQDNALSIFCGSSGGGFADSLAYGAAGWTRTGSRPGTVLDISSGKLRFSTSVTGAAGSAATVIDRIIVDANGLFTYLVDGTYYEVGLRNIPRVDQSGGSAAAALRGKMQGLTSTATYTIPSGIFNGGDVISICNFNAGAMTIAQGAGLTMRLSGTALNGNRTLAGFGTATIWFAGPVECFISGAGVS